MLGSGELTDRQYDMAEAIVRAAFCVGENGLPVSHMDSICSVARDTKSEQMPADGYWQNGKKAAACLRYTSAQLDKISRAEIMRSEWLGFTADGGTDRHTAHTMIVYIFYVYKGDMKCVFLDLSYCAGDARSITRCILSALGKPRPSSHIFPPHHSL